MTGDGCDPATAATGRIPSGKFNAGQKLNSAFVLGSVLVLFATGLMLHHFALFPDAIRTGATFVHDTFAAAVVVVSAGHLWMAAHDPEARRGLRTGFVTPGWAQREHALWAAQAEATRPDATAAQVVGPDSKRTSDPLVSVRPYRAGRRPAISSQVHTSVGQPPRCESSRSCRARVGRRRINRGSSSPAAHALQANGAPSAPLPGQSRRL